MPPVPVVTPTPAPSRRNQVSIVKLVTPSAGGAAPKVTWSLVPSKSSAAPAATDGVTAAAVEAAERLPAVSTDDDHVLVGGAVDGGRVDAAGARDERRAAEAVAGRGDGQAGAAEDAVAGQVGSR